MLRTFCLADLWRTAAHLAGLKHTFCKGPPPPGAPTKWDVLLGKWALFASFLSVTFAIMLFFSTVPIYSYTRDAYNDGSRGRITTLDNDDDWAHACNTWDKEKLAQWGLS